MADFFQTARFLVDVRNICKWLFPVENIMNFALAHYAVESKGDESNIFKSILNIFVNFMG